MKKIIMIMMFLLLGSLSLGSVFATNNLLSNIEAYWTFDNTMADATGNGNTAVNSGATYSASGKINGNYDFDGANDKISLNAIIPFDFGTSTINFWIKSPVNFATTLNDNYFFSAWKDTPNRFHLTPNVNGNGCVFYNAISSTYFTDYYYNCSVITTNAWNMITMVSRGDGTSEYYVNGNKITNMTLNKNLPNINSGNIFIGALADISAGTLFYDGMIDELGIWQTNLSATQISQLYNSGNGLSYSSFDTGAITPTINDNVTDFYNSANISINLTTATNTNMSYYLDSDLEVAICSDCNSTTLNLNSLSEGSHSILFESTDENGQVNSSANFTIDLTAPTINNSIPSLISYEFLDTYFSCSDTNLASCNISINSQNKASGINFTLTQNGNLSYTITAEDLAGNIATENGSTLISPDQYFRFYDTARALYVENYSFGDYNSSGQYIIIPLYDLGVGNHSLQFSKFGYALENFQFNFNSTSALNQTFNATPVTITIKVYSESSPATQLNFNLSVNNISNYTQYLNQLNFQKYYNETLTGNLTLMAESSGYSLRKMFTELSPYSAVSHTIYLLADADSTPVIFRTLNLAQTLAIEDVVFTFKKEIIGVPTFLGQAKTDSQGYTYFNMDILTDYEITISKDGYISQVINSIPGKSEYTILMEEEGSTGSFLFDDFSYLITPISSSINSFPFNASAIVFDEANLISSMRFTVTGDNTSKTQVLTAASGGTIQFEITNSSPQYVLNLTVMREGQEYNFIKKLNYYQTATTNATVQKVAQELQGETNSESRVFMIIIIYIVAVVLGSLFSPTVGAVCGLLPITIFAIPSVAWITPGIAALMYVFTILGVLYFER